MKSYKIKNLKKKRFFFLLLFTFQNHHLFWVYQNGNFPRGIFYREKAFHAGRKKSGKMTLPPLKNIPLTPLSKTFMIICHPEKNWLNCSYNTMWYDLQQNGITSNLLNGPLFKTTTDTTDLSPDLKRVSPPVFITYLRTYSVRNFNIQLISMQVLISVWFIFRSNVNYHGIPILYKRSGVVLLGNLGQLYHMVWSEIEFLNLIGYNFMNWLYAQIFLDSDLFYELVFQYMVGWRRFIHLWALYKM